MYETALKAVAEAIENLPPSDTKDRLESLVPYLIPGRWIHAEYLIAHEAQSLPEPDRSIIGDLISKVRDAAYAHYA